ncbi:MAG: sec-independent protein translocase protein TatC [Saprospiraceae bacterium]|jgi:sec-independent protein translocase protein TatC
MAIKKIEEGSLLSHLLELRDRMLRIVGVIFILFIPCAFFASELYEFIAKPLMSSLPQGNSMIATEPHAPFFVPFKFAIAVAFALSIPHTLFQLWAFIAPGLYRHEKRLAYPILISSTLLFYLGVVFAYFVVFPLVFGFFAKVIPDGVLMMTDIGSYLSFVIKLFFAFGLAFEVPVATVILVKMGISTPDKLAEKRPYIIIGAFILGMLLTPPDIFSQTLLAIPVWLLFELGLFASRRMTPTSPEEIEAEESEEDMDDEMKKAEKQISSLDSEPDPGP